MCMMEVEINGENKSDDKSKLHDPLTMPESDTGQTDAASNPEAGGSRVTSVEKSKPLHTLLSPSIDTCTVHEVSQSFTSTSRNGESHKMTTQTDGEDLCAAVLLGCLFCHPLDCLLATIRGLHLCSLSLCASLCGCEPTTLQHLLDFTHHCHVCGCLGTRCIMCDCSICDICLQATECLDLAMEISQMLYH